ncbi:MAG: rhomboid family intramembrane serine protease [Thermoplasmata archaeon]|nr:rhomboid family intramembrane serine protease [Thermoplasmata archaeon]
MSIIIIILIIASLVFGVLFVYLKKASFCLTLVVFEFIIFMVLFIAALSNDIDIGEVFHDLAYSSNYIVGKDASNEPYNNYKVFTLFTHLYLHGGPMHILSNMVFLVLLGIPFERKIGPVYFALIFYLSGILGSIFSSFFSVYYGDVFNLNPSWFAIGASGAIFGVLGAYVALYPKDKVWFPLIIIRPWPVWLIAGLYFGVETALAASGPRDNIGHFAHLGGLIGGLAIAPILGKLKLAQEQELEEGIVDLSQLKPLATDNKLKDIYIKIKNEDKPEIRNVWIEEFLTQAKCPNCGAKLIAKRGRVRCKCGFRLRY